MRAAPVPSIYSDVGIGAAVRRTIGVLKLESEPSMLEIAVVDNAVQRLRYRFPARELVALRRALRLVRDPAIVERTCGVMRSRGNLSSSRFVSHVEVCASHRVGEAPYVSLWARLPSGAPRTTPTILAGAELAALERALVACRPPFWDRLDDVEAEPAGHGE